MAKKKICPNCNEEIRDSLLICPNCKYIFEKKLGKDTGPIDISNLAMSLQLENLKKKKDIKKLNGSENMDKKKKNVKEEIKKNKWKKRKFKAKKINLLRWEYPKDESADIRYQQLIDEQNRESKKIIKELKKKWIDPNELEVIPHSKLWPKWH